MAGDLPADILRQLPPHTAVIASTTSTFGGHTFEIVALRSTKEAPSEHYLSGSDDAPPRPLMIFELGRTGHYAATGRNDAVIATADSAGLAGNGCDPFEDAHIAVKGAYFTVENEVACGAHWTDYITFRFEPRVGGYVFDNERYESLKLNPSNDPNAEALIPDVRQITRAPKDRFVPFDKWRPPTG